VVHSPAAAGDIQVEAAGDSPAVEDTRVAVADIRVVGVGSSRPEGDILAAEGDSPAAAEDIPAAAEDSQAAGVDIPAAGNIRPAAADMPAADNILPVDRRTACRTWGRTCCPAPRAWRSWGRQRPAAFRRHCKTSVRVYYLHRIWGILSIVAYRLHYITVLSKHITSSGEAGLFKAFS